MPDISIIVPIYNSEKYIKNCIDSLLNQTKKELEFIFINDGSTDNTESIIKEYKDKRIKYFKNSNQGIGKTRNFGINKSKGKYIMFIDSDDYLESNACEELYSYASNNNIDVVVFDTIRKYPRRKKKDIVDNFKESSLENNPKLLNIINLGPCNKLYRSSLIKDNNIRFEEKLKYEDAPFVIKTLDKAHKIGKLNKFLYNYVIHSNSETTSIDNKIFDILKIIDIIRNYFENKKYIQDNLNKLIVRMITNYTIQQRNQKDIQVGIKFINASFDYLEKYIPDYKDNKYYKTRGVLRRTIEKNKRLTIIYCRLYHMFHNR